MHQHDGLDPKGAKSGKPPAHRKGRHGAPVSKSRTIQTTAVVILVVAFIVLLIVTSH